MLSRNRRAPLWLMVLLVGCTPVAQSPATSSEAPAIPRVELTTSVRTLLPGEIVDGVPCLTADLADQHIHVHLQILYDGRDVPVPPGIGIGQPWHHDPSGFIVSGGCFAWIHVHDRSGVVHIVSPAEASFTLGQVFDVWGQPFGHASALGYEGSLMVLVNGHRVEGDPRRLRLTNLQNIVLVLGAPPATPPPALYDFTRISM